MRTFLAWSKDSVSWTVFPESHTLDGEPWKRLGAQLLCLTLFLAKGIIDKELNRTVLNAEACAITTPLEHY